MQPKRTGPYAGYDSLEEAVERLRRARFRVAATHRITRRGLVVEGLIVEGKIRVGMVLVPVHQRHENLRVALDIRGVDAIDYLGGVATIGLVLGEIPDPEVKFDPGTIVDVLERMPVGLTGN